MTTMTMRKTWKGRDVNDVQLPPIDAKLVAAKLKAASYVQPSRQARVPNRYYGERIAEAFRRHDEGFIPLSEYGNSRSANTIKWMVESGQGLKAFSEYPPGTFTAEVRYGTEVWFKLS